MNLLRTLALGLWMAGLYRVIFYPEWGPLAGRGWLWDPPPMASQVDPAGMLIEMALWNVGWLLSASHDRPGDWRLWLLTAIATLLVWQTRLHLLLLMGAGALLGAFGLV